MDECGNTDICVLITEVLTKKEKETFGYSGLLRVAIIDFSTTI